RRSRRDGTRSPVSARRNLADHHPSLNLLGHLPGDFDVAASADGLPRNEEQGDDGNGQHQWPHQYLQEHKGVLLRAWGKWRRRGGWRRINWRLGILRRNRGRSLGAKWIKIEVAHTQKKTETNKRKCEKDNSPSTC